MKHWQIIEGGNQFYAHIMSPSMALNDTSVFINFAERRTLRRELNHFEESLRLMGYRGWFSWTLLSRPHVMRLFSKIGANPYKVTTFRDSAEDQVWFKKEI